jgi:hypothetical protein
MNMQDWLRGADSAQEIAYRKRLRASMAGSIDFARRRQAKRLREGRGTVEVTVTKDELLETLLRQNYVCALTGLRFWTGTPESYAPRAPSLDRIAKNGSYSAENIRVILHGVNALRGTGTDDEMYEVALKLLENVGAVVDISGSRRLRMVGAPNTLINEIAANDAPVIVSSAEYHPCERPSQEARLPTAALRLSATNIWSESRMEEPAPSQHFPQGHPLKSQRHPRELLQHIGSFPLPLAVIVELHSSTLVLRKQGLWPPHVKV